MDFRKQLSGVVEFSRRGVGLFPGVDKTEAEGTVDRLIRGTTTRHHDCAVLWLGNEIALVYRVGSHTSKDGNFPAHVIMVARHRSDPGGHVWNEDVHVSDTSGDRYYVDMLSKGLLWSLGRLTPTVIATLMARAREKDRTFRADWDAQLAAKKAQVDREAAESAAKAQAREEKRQEAATRRASRLVSMVENAYAKAQGEGVYDRDALVRRVVKFMEES